MPTTEPDGPSFIGCTEVAEMAHRDYMCKLEAGHPPPHIDRGEDQFMSWQMKWWTVARVVRQEASIW